MEFITVVAEMFQVVWALDTIGVVPGDCWQGGLRRKKEDWMPRRRSGCTEDGDYERTGGVEERHVAWKR